MIETITEILKELDNDNEITKEIINLNFNEEKPLYEIYLSKIMSNIKIKIVKCKSKYMKFENDIKDKGDKYISYEILKQFINNNNDENEEDNNNAIKNMIIYCILYLKEKNNNSIKNITQIISGIKQIKDKEKDIDLSNISKTLNEKNKILKKEKFSGIRNLGNICYMNEVFVI